jgi:hypothetical protein
VRSSGPGLLSRLIRPREGPSKPSSGLYSLRESVPLRLRFRVTQGPMPSWFSSSPGLSPPCPPGDRRLPSAHALAADRLPCESRPSVRPSVLPDPVSAGLSRDCRPSRGFFLVPTRLFESPCGAGLLIPLEDVVPLPKRRLLSVRRLAPCRSSTGTAFRTASGDPRPIFPDHSIRNEICNSSAPPYQGWARPLDPDGATHTGYHTPGHTTFPTTCIAGFGLFSALFDRLY